MGKFFYHWLKMYEENQRLKSINQIGAKVYLKRIKTEKQKAFDNWYHRY